MIRSTGAERVQSTSFFPDYSFCLCGRKLRKSRANPYSSRQRFFWSDQLCKIRIWLTTVVSSMKRISILTFLTAVTSIIAIKFLTSADRHFGRIAFSLLLCIICMHVLPFFVCEPHVYFHFECLKDPIHSAYVRERLYWIRHFDFENVFLSNCSHSLLKTVSTAFFALYMYPWYLLMCLYIWNCTVSIVYLWNVSVTSDER